MYTGMMVRVTFCSNYNTSILILTTVSMGQMKWRIYSSVVPPFVYNFSLQVIGKKVIVLYMSCISCRVRFSRIDAHIGQCDNRSNWTRSTL